MQEIMDTEKFIQCIESHPDIWEKKSKYYKARNVRENNWVSIGNQMFSNWSELSDEQAQEKMKFMKSKWRNIRDSFMRCIQPERRIRASAKRKKYIYEDNLSFLLKTYRQKWDSKRKIVDDPNYTRTPKNEVEDEIEIDKPDLLELLPKTEAFETFPASSQLNFNKPDQTRNGEEDADRSFLMSLLPDVRKLNDGQRLDFRFHCLQFFRDLRQHSDVESTYTYSPSP